MALGHPADPKLVYGPAHRQPLATASRSPMGTLCHAVATRAVYAVGCCPFMSTPYALSSDEGPKQCCARMIAQLTLELTASAEIKAMIGEIQSEEFPMAQIQCSDTGKQENYTSRDDTSLLGPCAVAVNAPGDPAPLFASTASSRAGTQTASTNQTSSGGNTHRASTNPALTPASSPWCGTQRRARPQRRAVSWRA